MAALPGDKLQEPNGIHIMSGYLAGGGPQCDAGWELPWDVGEEVR